MGQTPATEREECVRCGCFARAAELDEQRVCEDCVSRLSPLERVPPSVGNVIGNGGWLLLKLGLKAMVLVAATTLPMYFLRTHGTYVPFVGWALDVLVQSVLLTMAHRTIHGRSVDLMTCVNATTDHLVRLLVVALLADLQIVLLYILPNIAAAMMISRSPDAALPLLLAAQMVGAALAFWRASSLSMALPIALHEGNTRLSALSASSRRTKGHRAPAFVFALAGLVWLMVPILHVAVSGLLHLLAELPDLFEASFAEEAVRLGAELGPALEIGHMALSALAMLFMTCTSAVLYAKTVPYRVH